MKKFYCQYYQFDQMSNSYTSINARLILIFLFMVAIIQVTAAQVAVQIPAKDEVLSTLMEQHPRLISTEKVEEIKQLIQEDEIAKQIWTSNREFAQALLDKPPVIYEKPDGRRLLRVSREALDRIRLLSLCYLVLGETRYAERAWQERGLNV